MGERIETRLNFDTPLEGAWSSVCGQANRRERLHANDLVNDAFDELVGIDTRIGRTLVDFTLRPGTAALAYA